MNVARRLKEIVTRHRDGGPSRTAPPAADNRRIVSMVDAGCSYAFIRRELRIGNARIDGALREQVDEHPLLPLHP